MPSHKGMMRMFWKMLMKEKRTAQLYTLAVFIVLSTIFFLITFYLQLNADQRWRDKTEINEQSVLNIHEAMITSELQWEVGDLLYIADTLSMREFDPRKFPALTRQWIAFSNRKMFYDQIRYIDSDGQERIRVNNKTGEAVAVPEEQRQNKKNRPYFIDTMQLLNNQLYISKLDLNIEGGEIEQPIKPMLRLAMPLFSKNGTREGIAIVNFTTNNILSKADKISASSRGDIFYLNAEGYWVYSSNDNGKEWAFMYEDRLEESFANEFPDVWEEMAQNEEGIVVTGDGFFTFKRIILDDIIAVSDIGVSLVCDANTYYLVSYIDNTEELNVAIFGRPADTAWNVLREYLSIYFLMSGIAFVMAGFIAVNKGQKKEIKYYSEYDVLTGVYNRRSAYEKMKALKKNDVKSCSLFAVCFIDINGLKEINDTLGHDAGDELIQTVVKGIQSSIRDQDFVARLGGDEFLIVFEGLPIDDAEKVWERITKYFAEINEQENRAYRISASHGISMFTCDRAISVDHVINQADEKMYLEKREIKKTLQVIRDQEI